jgi:hypothetical protein
MRFRQKVGLYCVFTISYAVVAMGALRTYSSYRLFFETMLHGLLATYGYGKF